VLSAPDPVLRAYPEDVRAGLLELALRPEIPSALSDRAAGALLATLPREGRTYPRLALRRAAQLLERHADDRARDVLDGLHRTRPDVHAAARWHAALEARRLGRVALAGELPAHGRHPPRRRAGALPLRTPVDPRARRSGRSGAARGGRRGGPPRPARLRAGAGPRAFGRGRRPRAGDGQCPRAHARRAARAV